MKDKNNQVIRCHIREKHSDESQECKDRDTKLIRWNKSCWGIFKMVFKMYSLIFGCFQKPSLFFFGKLEISMGTLSHIKNRGKHKTLNKVLHEIFLWIWNYEVKASVHAPTLQQLCFASHMWVVWRWHKAPWGRFPICIQQVVGATAIWCENALHRISSIQRSNLIECDQGTWPFDQKHRDIKGHDHSISCIKTYK